MESGNYCAKAALVRMTSGGETDENIIQFDFTCHFLKLPEIDR